MTTVNDLIERYRIEVLPENSPRTQRDYVRHLKVLSAHFGHMEANSVKPKDIGLFLQVTHGKIHRNRIVAVLSAIFKKAKGKWWVVDNNPCVGVERNASKPRDRYVTDEDYKTVYNAMPARIQIAMDLALLTGQRQGDLLTLRWEKVSPQGIEFTQGKTGKRLLVGMSPAVEAVLLRAKRLLPDLPREFVLRTRKGKPYTPEGFRAPWQRRMRVLQRRGVLKERFTFHDLRAKCVSDSTSLNEAFERAGHTEIKMTRLVYDRNVRKVSPLR